MPYTPSAINHLKTLAYHPDFNNVFLAFQLLKGNGWDDRLCTAVYWIQQRFIREQKKALVTQLDYIIQQHAPQLLSLSHLFAWAAMPINHLLPQCQLLKEIAPIDFKELAHALNQLPLRSLQQQAFLPFLIRFGDSNQQEKLFPLLIRRQHTGITSLDLSGYQLKKVPTAILSLSQLQELHLDDNQLTTLPDNLGNMDQLEILHLRDNQLSNLPPTFGQLQGLKRLYIQDNPWDILPLTNSLKTLPALEYISVGNNAPKKLQQLEALVVHGLLHASEQEQRLFLALELQDAIALEQLSLAELLVGLKHSKTTIRDFARVQLFKGQTTSLPLVKAQASIAILGLVSFAARAHLQQLKKSGWKITNEINALTTHIVLGDYPEQYEAVTERPFTFLSEQHILTLS